MISDKDRKILRRQLKKYGLLESFSREIKHQYYNTTDWYFTHCKEEFIFTYIMAYVATPNSNWKIISDKWSKYIGNQHEKQRKKTIL